MLRHYFQKYIGQIFSPSQKETPELARTYYYRAFAINSEGVSYGAVMRFHQPGPDWWLDLCLKQPMDGSLIHGWDPCTLPPTSGLPPSTGLYL